MNVFESTVFHTELGYCGLLFACRTPIRVFLPAQSRDQLELQIRKICPQTVPSSCGFSLLPGLIRLYCMGEKVHFRMGPESLTAHEQLAKTSHIPPKIAKITDFRMDILRSCCDLSYGQTASYSQLAAMASRPNAARAIGNALANNPLPIIIPCHRVIRSDGSLGGFMHNAPGAQELKKRMLKLEGVL